MFDYIEYKPQDLENDLDPDNNFYTKMQNNCGYFIEDQFETHVTSKDSFSIIHFNCGGLNAKFF